jgi:signal transduction histidine kinase
LDAAFGEIIMNTQTTPISSLPPAVAAAAEAHLLEHELSIWKQTDRLFAGLLLFEWLACIVLALTLSPRTYSGATSSVHPHLWAAGFLGFAIVSLPVLLALTRPATQASRHSIAVAQMLMSALLIHLGNGRIEMHFHIFGALAFLSFYRDWRVLVTGTVVIALDHLIRGLYLPESVYGVMSATIWRTLEHAGWVVFEDIILILSCVRGMDEMRRIATNRALLEQSYQDVERKVAERTAELKSTQQDLMKAARMAGMADIATSVLHNVGNVLNSVNVSATLVTEKLKQSELPSLGKVSEIIRANENNLAGFLTQDERGKMIPGFITDLFACLGEEQTSILAEVQSLSGGIEHIKQIVASQQSMAKTSHQVRTQTRPASLIDSAIAMASPSSSAVVEIHRNCQECPEMMIDQHKVMQILINLLSNARHAVMYRPQGQRHVTMSFEKIQGTTGPMLRYQVTDNGGGIAPENLTRIFAHGFTTKKEGHGFGLHSAANAAREMGGALSVASEGQGKGATFTLEIPAISAEEETTCQK